MFGYIRILPNQLRLCDATEYKQIYCGLCHQIAEYSQFSRLFLSFDMVFFAILSSYENRELAKKCTKKQCLRKKPCNDENMNYWAAVSVMMIYQKLLNDVQDGNRVKKLFVWDLETAYQKAQHDYPEAEKAIYSTLTQIGELERRKSDEPEKFMTAFGNLGSALVGMAPQAPQDTALKDVVQKIASVICEWIYCMDFYDDLDKDLEKGQYNPLLIQAQNEHADIEVVRQRFRSCIDQRVSELQRLCGFLPYGGLREIVCNVLHEGVISVTADVYGRCFVSKKYN